MQSRAVTGAALHSVLLQTKQPWGAAPGYGAPMHASFSRLADEYGCPFYLYEETAIAAQLAVLRGTFPNFSVLYSVKTNPHPAVCRCLAANGLGADAASSYEVRRALAAGFAPERIFYSAPGKTAEQLADALGNCMVTADSYSELARLDALAGASGMAANGPLPVGLRINPDAAFGPGEFPELTGGVSMKFGVDAESLEAHKALFASLRHIRPAGIHVYLRSQVLSHASLAASFAAVFSLATYCRDALGWKLSFINFGGGLGMAASATAPALDMDALRTEVGRLAAAHARFFPDCALLLESGRFLVGGCGTFVTRIEDIKESRGTTYLIAPGGLSGFLRPSVMHLLGGLPFPVQGPFEPLFSNSEAHRAALPEKAQGALKRVTVCGNLCTALDVMAKDAMLPDPQIGDILTVGNAGAYAATLSPFAFGSFPRPAELYRDSGGSIKSASSSEGVISRL